MYVYVNMNVNINVTGDTNDLIVFNEALPYLFSSTAGRGIFKVS